ncbi:MAG TPA: hypothetical protein VIE43_00855 [Thermoanaerobaculia bacterium]|nr:hypothetical protein [Thermoanaerobaculia bacterium]
MNARSCLRSVTAVLALALGALPAIAAPPICDGSTALTLIGMDTSTGRTLFSIPPLRDDQPSWIVELSGDGREAHAWPDDAKGRYGGSVGPGPVLAAQPCGPSCVQPVRWNAGAWEPVGESLSAPTASSADPTYDQSGAPWFLMHGVSGTAGQEMAWAFRYEGREWKSRGSMVVAAVGQPSALPAPQRKDGVLTGTGLFSASGEPQAWVSGLPGITTERRGQLIALTGTSAAYVSGDGVVYLSDDSGKKWRRSTWTPWGAPGGSPETVGIWRQGQDYWVDFPFGDHRGSLRLVWFDRRVASEEKIVLTRLSPSGDWIKLTELPSEVKTKNGEHLAVTQILVPKGEDWILLTGCAATADGSGLVLRVFDGKSVSDARFVPMQTGAPAAK